MFKCEMCKREFETLSGFATHIGTIHKNEITREEYYIKYIGNKNKCVKCGKDVRFISFKNGYNKFCSYKCSANSTEVQNKRKETSLKNSGFENPSQDPKVKEKKKQTCLEKSGYEYPGQNPVNKEKSKQTCLEKSGYEYPGQNPKTKEKILESSLKNNNGIFPSRLTYKKLKEKNPLLIEIEKLIEGPNGEIWGHCKNSNCKNSKENGGYFKLTPGQINSRNTGINGHDTAHFYCCEECKHTCPLYGKSASALHNLITENKEILYTTAEYNIWKEEVYYRQRIENNTETNFCEYCHTTENLQVHHEIPQKLEPGYALDPINGIIACKDCHYEKGHKAGSECSTSNLANKICK